VSGEKKRTRFVVRGRGGRRAVLLTTKGQQLGYSADQRRASQACRRDVERQCCSGSGAEMESGAAVGDKKVRRKSASASVGDYVLGVERERSTRVVGRRGGAARVWLALGPFKDAKLDAIKMHASLLADACISRPRAPLGSSHRSKPNRRSGACMLARLCGASWLQRLPTTVASALAVRCTCTALHNSPSAITSEIRQPNEDA
jgi:hypothetical protein